MDPESIQDLFHELGPVRIRRMFGGQGIYAGERMFALEARGALYLKADDVNRPAARGRRIAAVRLWGERQIRHHELLADAGGRDRRSLGGGAMGAPRHRGGPAVGNGKTRQEEVSDVARRVSPAGSGQPRSGDVRQALLVGMFLVGDGAVAAGSLGHIHALIGAIEAGPCRPRRGGTWRRRPRS